MRSEHRDESTAEVLRRNGAHHIRVLVLTPEYGAFGSGIAMVSESLCHKLEEKGVVFTVFTPRDSPLAGLWKRILGPFGGPALAAFWAEAIIHARRSCDQYDWCWFHQPLSVLSPPHNSLFTYHTSYHGYSTSENSCRSEKLNVYYRFMSMIEKLAIIRSGRGGQHIAVSDSVSQEIHDVSKKRLMPIVIGNGTNSHLTENQNPPRTRSSRIDHNDVTEIRFLTVGRLTQQKNLPAILDSFSELHKHVDHVKLLVAGRGELGPELTATTVRQKMDYVELLGFVPSNQLTTLYMSSPFYVQGSCYEGEPLSLIDSLGFGCIPIVNDVPSLTYHVRKSGYGIIVDFSSPDDAASLILEYIQKVDIPRTRMCIRQYAEVNLSWSSKADEYLRILKRREAGH